MRIINLIENTEGASGCSVEHGLCFYIETEKHKLLMDTGQTELLLENAKKLGIDLTQVDTVVLSHGHYDHGGGILPFAKINPTAKIYVPEAAFGEYYAVNKDGEPHYIGLAKEIQELPQVVKVSAEAKPQAREEAGASSGIYRIDDELGCARFADGRLECRPGGPQFVHGGVPGGTRRAVCGLPRRLFRLLRRERYAVLRLLQ